MRHGAWVMRGAGLMAAFALAGCGEEEAAPRAERPAPIVEVARVETRPLDRVVEAVGSIEASERVWASAEVEGVVAEVLFREGDLVEAGAALFRLDDEMPRLDVEAARAAVSRAEAEAVERRAVLARKDLLQGVATPAEMLEARQGAARAEASLAEARAREALAAVRLARTAVLAPFAGRLGERRAGQGDYVKAGDPLVEVVHADPADLVFSVPERFLPSLRSGMRAEATVGTRAAPLSGEVFYIAPAVEDATRSIRLKARLSNADGALVPGTFARVRLVLESVAQARLVPEAAIVPRAGAAWVYVVEEGRARRVEVRTGTRVPGAVEILEGLVGDEVVVVAGHERVGDGTPVRIAE
ncbi:MAG: efflux RND transporter periplasmic adaptor subunit [Planctomycetes bacterium]|nr:efflux RND transporter periplasmic adaptor subunit [Planctomycetota bacterium]